MPTDRIIEPLSQDLPLTPPPHLSRVTQHELSADLSDGGSKNYKHVAFRPGYALQAAELNELQEQFQLQMTLTMNMYHNWITSSRPSLWDTASQTTTGIGNTPDDGTGEYAVSAPGWRGTCPLFPFDSPYTPGGATNIVEVEPDASGGISVLFRPGWFLTELQAQEDPGEDISAISGLKYWVYNNIPVAESGIIIPAPTSLTYVGFRVSSSYVCPDEDSSLYDNAGPYSTGNPSTGGACRYQLRLDSTGFVEDSDGQVNNISKVLKIDPSDRSIRYMNNLFIASY